jgi:Zn-dependent peptidase ImmA (M78 family)/transcriptional regulator with XRE-family HTH domain
MRKSELARLVHATPAALTQIESGTVKPSPKMISQLALALGFPMAFFAQDKQRVIPTTGQPFLRSLRSARQIDRDQIDAHATLLYDFTRFLERYVVFPEVRFPELWVPPEAKDEEVEERADQLRELWSVQPGPLPSVVHLLEIHGAIVTRHTMGRRELDAFSRVFDARPLVVLGDDKVDLGRQRFDAAHELGHLVLHGEAEPGTHVTEHQAHVFAAAFLMPSETITAQLPRRLDWHQLFALKHVWGVSVAALLFRSRDLGVLSEATYRRAMSKMSMWGWRSQEPQPVSGEQNPTVLPRAMALLREQRVTNDQIRREVGYPEGLIEEIEAVTAARPRITFD